VGAAVIAGARSSTAPAPALLLERAAAGDAEAFDVLIRPRLDKLFRMAIAITHSETDARDAVQEACVSAWRQLPKLRDRDRFDPWLAQILVNACRAHLRRQRRTSVREIRVGEPDDESTAAGFSTGGHGEQIAEVEAIRRAFDRLDPDVRALLVLHYQEEQPLADIARTLGAPVGTIKWRLSNARKALDRALKVERR
jgi:RNA polymerase sigma-70 factor (ECF subfamily)